MWWLDSPCTLVDCPTQLTIFLLMLCHNKYEKEHSMAICYLPPISSFDLKRCRKLFLLLHLFNKLCFFPVFRTGRFIAANIKDFFLCVCVRNSQVFGDSGVNYRQLSEFQLIQFVHIQQLNVNSNHHKNGKCFTISLPSFVNMQIRASWRWPLKRHKAANVLSMQVSWLQFHPDLIKCF